jgi:hypothetical protein
MLKVDDRELASMEVQHPGITATIRATRPIVRIRALHPSTESPFLDPGRGPESRPSDRSQRRTATETP